MEYRNAQSYQKIKLGSAENEPPSNYSGAEMWKVDNIELPDDWKYREDLTYEQAYKAYLKEMPVVLQNYPQRADWYYYVVAIQNNDPSSAGTWRSAEKPSAERMKRYDLKGLHNLTYEQAATAFYYDHMGVLVRADMQATPDLYYLTLSKE